MSGKIKDYFIGALAVALVALSLHTYLWAGRVNLEAQAGAASFKYLTEPIAKRSDGSAVTRAMVIDEFIKQAQRANQSQGGFGATNGKN